MKKYYYIFILSLFVCSIKMAANPIISFFFRPLSNIERTLRKLKKPGNLVKNQLNGALNYPSVMGILALYAGYMTASDFSGQIIFPRKHHSSSIYVVVTPELVPVMLFENTVDHWELVPGVASAMYSYEQKYNNKTEQYYWQVQEESTPTDYKIPLNSIIIVAKSKNIVIPSGVTPTRETANFVLPPIFITKGINIVANDIYMLTFRHLFKPVDVKKKREPVQILIHVND